MFVYLLKRRLKRKVKKKIFDAYVTVVSICRWLLFFDAPSTLRTIIFQTMEQSRLSRAHNVPSFIHSRYHVNYESWMAEFSQSYLHVNFCRCFPLFNHDRTWHSATVNAAAQTHVNSGRAIGSCIANCDTFFFLHQINNNN